jgi:hypothetical protein
VLKRNQNSTLMIFAQVNHWRAPTEERTKAGRDRISIVHFFAPEVEFRDRVST